MRRQPRWRDRRGFVSSRLPVSFPGRPILAGTCRDGGSPSSEAAGRSCRRASAPTRPAARVFWDSESEAREHAPAACCAPRGGRSGDWAAGLGRRPGVVRPRTPSESSMAGVGAAGRGARSESARVARIRVGTSVARRFAARWRVPGPGWAGRARFGRARLRNPHDDCLRRIGRGSSPRSMLSQDPAIAACAGSIPAIAALVRSAAALAQCPCAARVMTLRVPSIAGRSRPPPAQPVAELKLGAAGRPGRCQRRGRLAQLHCRSLREQAIPDPLVTREPPPLPSI